MIDLDKRRQDGIKLCEEIMDIVETTDLRVGQILDNLHEDDLYYRENDILLANLIEDRRVLEY